MRGRKVLYRSVSYLSGFDNNYLYKSMLYKQLLKLIVFNSFFIFLLGCSSNERNLYDESDYTLVKTETDNGIVYRKDYVYKHDTAREMKTEYWDNGRIMSKWFLYHKRLDGKSIKYDMQGKILAIDSFQNGIKVYSKEFFVSDTSVKIFKDGKLSSFKSADSLK